MVGDIIDRTEELLFLEELPDRLLIRGEKVFCSKTIPFDKVLWRNYNVNEATWEPKEHMQAMYPNIFYY